MAKKIIRLSSPGASGAAGGGSTPAALQISAALPSGVVGNAYSGALIATGGVPPFTFSISVGSLPPGLSLNTTTGAVTGTPTTPGTYTFTGRVVDSASTSATVSCTVAVPNAATGENVGTVTAVTATEIANGVYQETGGGLLMQVSVTSTTTAAAFPVRERLWIDFDDGRGDILIGDKYATGASTTWVIGAPDQQTGVTIAPPDAVWVPTDPTKINWRATVEANSNAPAPGGYAQHYDFTVTPAQQVPHSDITNIHFVPNDQTGDIIIYALADPGVWYYIWNLLEYTQPSVGPTGDPYFKSSFCTKQLGYAVTGACNVSGTSVTLTSGTASASDVGNLIHLGQALVRIASYTDATHIIITSTSLNGVAVVNGSGQSYEIWRPAPVAIFGDEGADDPDAQAMGYWGRRFTDGEVPSVAGPTVVQKPGTPSWNMPPTTMPDGSANPYQEMRIWVFAVSRLADNESGGSETITLETGWPSAADHGSLFPTAQAAALDLTKSKASTLGGGLGKEFGTGRVKVNTSTTVGTDGSNAVVVNPSSLGNVHILPGELGADLSKWSSSASPWGIYFGLPSPSAANVPNIIINTAETPWRIYNKVGGSWVAQSTRPGDLIAGTIAALVSIVSPSISGGSITGTTITLTNGTKTITIDPSNFLKITDSSNGYQALLNAVGINFSNGLGYNTTLTPLAFGMSLGSDSCGLTPFGFAANGLGGATTTISYAKPGGGSGTLTYTKGILTSWT